MALEGKEEGRGWSRVTAGRAVLEDFRGLLDFDWYSSEDRCSSSSQVSKSQHDRSLGKMNQALWGRQLLFLAELEGQAREQG